MLWPKPDWPGLAGANQSQLDEASFQVQQIEQRIAERSLRGAAASQTALRTALACFDELERQSQKPT